MAVKRADPIETIEPLPHGKRIEDLRIPGLTVLFHPEITRVGEIARLGELPQGRAASLSRVEPDFAPPGSVLASAPSKRTEGGPLRDPHLSRTPVRIEPSDGGGVRLRWAGRGSVKLDGEPLGEPREVSRAELAGGLVLELGDRVVLLLHQLGPPVARQPALGMVGDSEALERLRAELCKIADLSAPVLFAGESGTGKELAARALAALGPRASGPFVAVNMAALPASIAASELFGHAAGAFTGAAEPHRGHFAQADGGTIFLDEIGAIPLDVQAMLLRVLETMELQPLGSARRVRVDLRVLAATDEDLERSVRDGRFRDALRHRLTGYQVQLPPLRARRDDVGRLLAHFLGVELRALGEERRLAELDKAEPWLPASLVAEACRHHWPGNVRQLANAARRLAVAARGGGRADRATLAPVLGQPPPAPRVEEVVSPGRRPPSRIEEDDLVAALRASGWRIAEAARRLGISRTSLYALIEASSRIRKAGEIPAEEIQACRRECAGDVEAMAGRLETSARGLLLRLRELGIR